MRINISLYVILEMRKFSSGNSERVVFTLIPIFLYVQEHINFPRILRFTLSTQVDSHHSMNLISLLNPSIHPLNMYTHPIFISLSKILILSIPPHLPQHIRSSQSRYRILTCPFYNLSFEKRMNSL